MLNNACAVDTDVGHRSTQILCCYGVVSFAYNVWIVCSGVSAHGTLMDPGLASLSA